MSHNRTYRLEYVRVLVEIKEDKVFQENIKIHYVDDKKNTKTTKWVNVEYTWKLAVCSHCEVFAMALIPARQDQNY